MLLVDGRDPNRERLSPQQPHVASSREVRAGQKTILRARVLICEDLIGPRVGGRVRFGGYAQLFNAQLPQVMAGAFVFSTPWARSQRPKNSHGRRLR
jgi:hypothetical protein